MKNNGCIGIRMGKIFLKQMKLIQILVRVSALAKFGECVAWNINLYRTTVLGHFVDPPRQKRGRNECKNTIY